VRSVPLHGRDGCFEFLHYSNFEFVLNFEFRPLGSVTESVGAARVSGRVSAASHWLRSPRGLVPVANGSVGSLSQWHVRV